MGNYSKKTLRPIAIGLALILGGAMVGCSSDDAGTEAATKVTLGVSQSMGPNNSPLAIAQHFDFFAEEGLDLEIIVTGDSTSSVQGVVSGQLDISSTPPEPILQVQSVGTSGDELVMVYNYVREQTGSLAVPAGSGIASLKDFEGATIGVSDLASSNILLTNGMLATAGLEPEVDYTFLAVGTGAAALQALQAGHVQGLALWDTEYAAMEATGAKLEFFTTPEIASLFSTTFFTSAGYLDNNGDVIDAFGRAMAKATYFISLNLEAALRIMYNDYPETLGAGRSVEDQLAVDLVSLGARVNLLTAGDPASNGTWGAYSPEAVEQWTTFAFESGIIPSPVESAAAFSNDHVEAYNDFDASVVKALAENWKE